MNPATSSDSASTRSKGGRLVSASAETKNTMNIGRSGSQYQFRKASHGRPILVARPVCCDLTMPVRLSEPAQSRTVMITQPIDTSYETICAADLSAARNGYFEFDAHPPMITPYTPNHQIPNVQE